MRVNLNCIACIAATIACVVACAQHQGAETMLPVAAGVRQANRDAHVDLVAITGIGKNRKLDRAVSDFMAGNDVPNAELAIWRSGHIAFSHAYTNRRIAISTTKRSTIIRLASLSKAWTSAALYNLLASHKIELRWKVFRYLGITKPLPVDAYVDPRVYQISIEDMILHESGWDDGVSHWDPTFRMRQIALALGLKGPIDRTQEVRYQLHQPLQENPGTTYAYCNFCYTVLGMVVAKASGMSYETYLSKAVEAKLGIDNVVISPTVGTRAPDEVSYYYNPYFGKSALYIESNRKFPFAYSGDSLLNEVAQGAGGLATNADSMLSLMSRYIIWGVGTPPPLGQSAAREGEMPGANTYAAQLPNGVNYAFLVNTNAYAYGSNAYAFTELQALIAATLSRP
jgi:CubicO group peptidase (beta-lactamase class C family)